MIRPPDRKATLLRTGARSPQKRPSRRHWCRPHTSDDHNASLATNAPTAVATALRATAEHEKHAIAVEPRGESAKADFAVSGATSVAGRA